MKKYTQALLAALLLFVLLLRGGTLGGVDLLDPTETRYATIAANMTATGDYLTPRLVEGEQLETYFSKPPLHYWLTCGVYKVFGLEEWTARLPSFLGLLLMTACLLVLGKRLFTVEIGLLAALINSCSPLVFYMAGGCHVDMTFAAWITLALTCYLLLVQEEPTRVRRYGLSSLFGAAVAAAFVTKGPLGLVLIGGPIGMWTVLSGAWSKLGRLYWPLAVVLMVALGAPWFYLVEQENPGFLNYFFVNENFLRYIKHDYGGRHGANHTHVYGYIWLFFIVSILPWLIPFVVQSFKLVKTRRWALLREEPLLLFLGIWGLLPAAFFTLSSSILPAYLLPGMPGLSLVIAILVRAEARDLKPGRVAAFFNWFPALIGLGFLIAGIVFHAPVVTLGFVVLLLGGLVWLGKRVEARQLADLYVRRAVVSSVVLTLAVMVFSERIGGNKSSSQVLKYICENVGEGVPKVAVISTNNQSPFWLERARKNELGAPIEISPQTVAGLLQTKIPNLINRSKHNEIPPELLEVYRREAKRGSWVWYVRK